jgi:ribosome-associated protein
VSTRPSTTTLDALAISRAAARAAADKKGRDPVVLDVSRVLGIVDTFVIVSGNNDRQVRTIAEEVEAKVKEAGGPAPRSVEGRADASWVLLDYGDVAVHVFLEETRRYYDLERLWRDAPRLDWEDESDLASVGWPGRGTG